MTMTTEALLAVLKAERAYVGTAESAQANLGDFDVCHFADGTFGAGKNTSEAVLCALRNRAAEELITTLEDFLLDLDNGLGPSIERLRDAVKKARG